MNWKFILSLLLLFSSQIFAQGSGCPDIVASPDQIIPCNQTCTQISATPFNVGETNIYTVSSIPHAPPIAYNAPGGTAVSVNTDDVWSGVINLPFPFCFFGQTYNSCLIGSNGAIGFDVSVAGGYHPWPFSASVPSTALTTAGNIFGPYHDIDPSVAGTVRWYLTGQAPCRTFIVSYNNLGHYDCESLRSTHMMVLYETTNIIEVYVNNKQTCTGWNSGNTVIGIQNAAGTVGYTPPGRNTGAWTVNSPEAWQFKPNGAPINSTVEWYEGPTLVGTGNTITVCPTNPTHTYEARTTYTRCDGFQINVQDQVNIVYDAVTVAVNPPNTFTCAGSSTTLTASSPTATNYSWSPGGMTGPTVNVSPLTTTTYTVTASNTANGCSATASATVSIAQPVSTACNVLYVTPTGSPSGTGSQASPLDLETALEQGACNGTIIKMAIGNYVTDSTINKITSYITLEGGFDPSLAWDKISTAGATRILRTATQTTSLVSGNGIDNENGANPEVVAIAVSNQSGFRFQDLTIEVQGLGGGTTYSGYQGVDIVGVRLNSCSDYNIIRSQIIAGSASNGANQIWSIPATNGGNARGMEILANGSNTVINNSNVTAGAGGTGGTGGGANGSSTAIFLTGTALSTNNSNFNLAAQTQIRMDDIACTATNIGFSSAASNNWNFGSGSSPTTAVGASVNTQYSNIGRKDITYGANAYIGFANIILDDQILPTFSTSATFHQSQFRVCAGSNVSFTATNGGIGYVYNWNLGGGASGTNIFSGTTFQTVSGTFNTPGIYTIELSYFTNCCGNSSPTTITLYVEDQPIALASPDANLCLGDFGGATIWVDGALPNGTISWSPVSSSNDSVVVLPIVSTTYNVILEDSTGLCSSTDDVLISVTDLVINPSTTAASCAVLGTASVVVSGGSGNYSYLWSNGSGGSSINNLQPGTYEVIVTDLTLSCTDSLDVTVPAGPGALVGSLLTTDILCAGAANGSITASVSGGTPPYTYSWSPIVANITTTDTFQTQINLLQGNYTVLVTDNSGCEFTATETIEESSPINFSIDSISDPSCIGVMDGFIRIRTDGGERPYTFTWSNALPVILVNDDVVLSSLGAGTYTLYLTDDFGCEDSISLTLVYPPLQTTIVDTTVCFGSSYTFPNNSVQIITSNLVRNDTIVASNSCDSLVITQITSLGFSIVTIDTTICEGENISVNGVNYSASGTYNDTAFYVASGCDSIQYVINLQVDSFTVQTIDTTLCQGQSLTVNGVNYTIAGSYNDTAFYSISGCDSIQYIINLAIDSFSVVTIDTTLCQGQNLTVNGVNYSSSGTYNDTLFHALSGCDSIQFVINLQVDSFQVVNIDTSLCQGQTLTVNGVNYTAAGNYNDTAFYALSGCDSIQYLINLQIDSFSVVTIDTSLCQGQTITVNGITYGGSGSFNDTAFYTASGCDSIQYIINLQVDSFVVQTIDTAICQGQTLTVNGVNYAASGQYFDTLFHVLSGCDSIQYVINLQVDSFTVQTIDTTLCQGQSLTVNGVNYTIAGSYNDTAFYATSGCDSIQYIINLAIDSFSVVTIDTTLCQGQTLTVNGINYSSSGTYNDTLFHALSGCDSIQFVINLQVDSFQVVNIDTTLCQGQTLTVNGVNYTAAGNYNDTAFYALSGCDSIQYLINLQIDSFSVVTIDTSLCQGQTITVNGITYGGSGSFNDTAFYTASGCDSIQYIINLQVDSFVVQTIDTAICQGETLTVNGVNYAASGQYFDTLFHVLSGCDSIQYVINLQVDSFTVQTIDTTLCQGQSLTVNGVNYTTAGSYNDTAFYASSGCDSIQYIINLAIDSFSVVTIDTTLCQGQTLTVNGINYTSSGTYNDTLSHTFSGCDSIQFVINLAIDSFQVVNIDTILCQGESISINGVNYNVPGSYSDTLFHQISGCDSLIYNLNLSIQALPNVQANSSEADSATCINQSLSLFGSGTPSVTYSWNNGVSNNVAFNPPLGSTTYIVTGTDTVGCISSDTITIIGYPTFTSTINATICEDENYILPNGNLVNSAGTYPVTLASNQACDSIITTILAVNQIGSFTPLEDVAICDGFSQTLELISSNMTSFEWFVNDGTGAVSLLGNPNYNGANTTSLSFNLNPSLHQNVYTVNMLDECGNAYSSNMTLSVYESHLVANPIDDTTFCAHEISAITVDYNGNNYVWNTGQIGPSIIPDFSGEYIVEFVENVTNCLLSDTIQITIEDCIGNCVVLAPTGFSPNASGSNDIFRVVTTCDEGFSYFYFAVFNRWGELIYTTDDWREGWDGTYKGRDAEIGTYTFFVEYTKELTNKKEMLKGNVTLIK